MFTCEIAVEYDGTIESLKTNMAAAIDNAAEMIQRHVHNRPERGKLSFNCGTWDGPNYVLMWCNRGTLEENQIY